MGSRGSKQTRSRQAQQQRRTARKARQQRPVPPPVDHADRSSEANRAEHYLGPETAGRSTRAERVRQAASERTPAGPSITRTDADVQAWALIQKAAMYASATRSRPHDSLLVDLAVFDSRLPPALAGVHLEAATTRLVTALRDRYENGWQPADVVHGVTRSSKSRIAGEWVRRLIGYEAALSGAHDRAPQQWIDQLPPASGIESWRLLAGFTDPLEGWAVITQVVGALVTLPRIQRLVPPPSAWGTARPRVAAATPPGKGSGGESRRKDPKMLARIRALLAKAEGTEYAQEAEAFTGKAQELMARYAIDDALLADPAAGVDVHSRRIHIEDPYAEQKALLADVCAQAQHCKAVWAGDVGISTIIGPPTELELADMLYTSLLVQAVRAMTEAGRFRGDRSPSFRRAFLTSYASRIAERLADSNARADEQVVAEIGAELVPVRARIDAAVADEFDRLFPHIVRGKARSYDARGWHAGRAAADAAVFSRGRLES